MLKKGELTTQQIVILIILIASFSVLLIFFFRLDLGKTTDKEVCHNSVLMKSKGKGFFGGNLDCKTTYVCISGEENCEKFTATETKKINLNQEDGKIKKEIIKIIAEEMADCWWMFGEGKIDYAQDWEGTHCAICSQIKFSKELEEKINLQEIYNELNEIKKDNKKTYSIYLYNKDVSFQEIQNKYSIQNNKINSQEKYTIITGINGQGILEIGNNKILPVYFIPSSEVNKFKCDIFDLTKA